METKMSKTDAREVVERKDKAIERCGYVASV